MKRILVTALIALPVIVASQDAERSLYSAGQLSSESVQRELDLTNWQKTRLKNLFERTRNNARIFAAPPLSESSRAAWSADENRLLAMLAPWQKDRLKQITLQVGGLELTANPLVREQLGITADQREKFKAINESYRTQITPLMEETKTLHGLGSQAAFDKRMKEISWSMGVARREAGKKMFAALNANQQKQWLTMVGKPYSWGADHPLPPGAPPLDKD